MILTILDLLICLTFYYPAPLRTFRFTVTVSVNSSCFQIYKIVNTPFLIVIKTVYAIYNNISLIVIEHINLFIKFYGNTFGSKQYQYNIFIN